MHNHFQLLANDHEVEFSAAENKSSRLHEFSFQGRRSKKDGKEDFKAITSHMQERKLAEVKC